ncbi:hypothetical protein HHX47_DHR5000888 [Lentinula edodes]|nr:hypothetical protein HHX47_DHR5000888 [Lentinula edodes]
MFVASILGSLVLCVQVAVALRPNGRLNRATPIAPIPEEALSEGPVVSRNGTQLPPYNTTYIFNQLIDHTNPSLGTFQQRYWHTYEWYETGGPIILNTPGEANAQPYTGYLTNATINGQIAQQQSGATIVLEHRFYGLSNPVPNLSGRNLKLHTIQQAIDDLAYFAENVVLPMPNGAHLSPADAPWILIGGSYSGALTSWTLVNKPDVFWAGYASSAVVEAILDYWGYFEPIRQFMPANCSADVEAVIAHVDEVFSGNDATAIQVLKDNWGLGEMTHLDDVAGFRNNLWDWQSLSPTSGPGATFFQFCDALEVKDGVNAPATGWGLDHALTAWGSFWNETYLDAHVFASPADVPMAAGVANVNKQYTGWNVSVDRLFFANGQRDPWREATVSADGVDVASTNTQPIAIGDGFHCSDLLTSAGTVDKTVRAVQTEALSFMKTWLAEWEPPSKTSKREISEARHSRFFKNVAA